MPDVVCSAVCQFGDQNELIPDEVLHDIVEVSTVRNRALDVSGAMISTGHNYVQFLEGDQNAVDELMASISVDPRHRDIKYVLKGPRTQRRFSSWSLAYAGPSYFVSRQVRSLLQSDPNIDGPRSAERIIEFMMGMASTDSP